MPQKSRREHGRPCRRRMRGIHAQRRGRHRRGFEMRRLRLPPQFPPQGSRRRGAALQFVPIPHPGGGASSRPGWVLGGGAGDNELRRRGILERGSEHVPVRRRGACIAAAVVEEAVPDEIQPGTEASDAGIGGEIGVEDSEARRAGGAAALPGNRNQEAGFQGVDAQ